MPLALISLSIIFLGPIGATFAKKCVDAGLRVVMCEIGAAFVLVPHSCSQMLTGTIYSDSFTSKRIKGNHKPTPNDETYAVNFEEGYVKVPGYHKKNEIEYQKDIDRFVK